MVFTTAAPASPGLPTAAIVCICIGAYIVLIVILLMIRECLMKRNMWHSAACCGQEGEVYCCECWISCCESCNCCQSPNITVCLDSICPQRRKGGCCQHYDCGDIVACQCCAECCKSCCGENGCDCCEGCNCNCQAPECDTINCCCCEIQIKQPMNPATPRYNNYPSQQRGYPEGEGRGGYNYPPPQRGYPEGEGRGGYNYPPQQRGYPGSARAGGGHDYPPQQRGYSGNAGGGGGRGYPSAGGRPLPERQGNINSAFLARGAPPS